MTARHEDSGWRFVGIVVGAVRHCRVLLAPLHAAALDADAGLRRFESTEPQMGVPFKIILYAADETTANAAFDAAFSRVAELNRVLSDYDPDSELSRLSPLRRLGRRRSPERSAVDRAVALAGAGRANGRGLRRDGRSLRATVAPRPPLERDALARAAGRSPRGGRLSVSQARCKRAHRAAAAAEHAARPGRNRDGLCRRRNAEAARASAALRARWSTPAATSASAIRRPASRVGRSTSCRSRPTGTPSTIHLSGQRRGDAPPATPFNTSTSTASAIRTSSIRIPAWA